VGQVDVTRIEAGLADIRRGGIGTTIQRAIAARNGAYALACIVLLSLAFRVHVSGECSLWLDEATTHRGIQKPWPKILAGPSKVHPPLMYLLVAGAVKLLGDSETALRSVSLFFGCVLLVAIYELCLELGLTVGRALIVVATIALSPFFIRHATEARHYAMLAAFVTLATTRALRILRGSTKVRDLVGFAVSVLSASFTQYFGLAYSLALVATVAVGLAPAWKQSRPLRRGALLGSLIGLLAALGFDAVRAAAVERSFEPSEPRAVHALNTALLLEFPREFSLLTNQTFAMVIEPALALVGIALLSFRLRGLARWLPLGLGVVPCVAALFISSDHFVSARYLAPSWVFYHLGACVAVLAAVDLLRRGRALGARAAWLAPQVGWLLLACVVTARLSEFPKGFGAGGEDYRGLQRYFLANLGADSRLVACFGSFGKVLFGKEYPVGSRPISLERFRPVRGVDRYLVVELHIDGPERTAMLESLVERHFGLSRQAWRSVPLVPVPHSRYQPPVLARLVHLPRDRVPARRKPKR
jgi:hypothetical protein